ncbi:MAG: DUF4169 family protein [Rhodobacteraceae bacterium]|nr:DUF4169 family protein [Paracoccaceae bacterium]
MSDVVNLRRARKQRKRAGERDAASVRAAAFGEGASARSLRAAEAGRAERRLEQHRVDGNPPGEPRREGERPDRERLDPETRDAPETA